MLTDEQIDALWIMRSQTHGGELMPQLRDFARAVLLATHSAGTPWKIQHQADIYRVFGLTERAEAAEYCAKIVEEAGAGEPKLSMLTEPQIEAINDAIATLDRRGWPIDEYFAKVFREMLAAHSAGAQVPPINMLLFCPKCGAQHVDAPEKVSGGRPVLYADAWTNPPHRSHLCAQCGTVWRPADVPTNGVAKIETQGKADTWDVATHPQPTTQTDAARDSRDCPCADWGGRIDYSMGYPCPICTVCGVRKGALCKAEIERLDRAKGE